MSLDKLHSILSVIFNNRLIVSNLYIFAVEENVTGKVDGGINIIMIVSIAAGGTVVLLIIILIVVCVSTYKKRKLHEASFDISLCEYCTVCNGGIYIQ